MKCIIVGIDVGNYDTKTQSTSTPSGFGVYSKPPFGASEVLEYNGNCYVPEVTRFPYVKDKSVDDNAFILSLFGIAKEIIARLKKKNIPDNKLQEEISKITHLNIGVGLPPTHMSKQTESLTLYYRNHFGDGIKFKYNDYEYWLKLSHLRVYPQDFAAVMTYHINDENFITNKYNSYYAIDIGGYTVDVVPIINGQPDVNKCDSKELGVLKMYDKIITAIEREEGISLNAERIESVLLNENTILPESVIAMIKDMAEDWINMILNQLRQNGLEFSAYPVIFIGGGSQLFRPYIKKNSLLTAYAFIPSPKANADGYRKLMDLELRKKG